MKSSFEIEVDALVRRLDEKGDTFRDGAKAADVIRSLRRRWESQESALQDVIGDKVRQAAYIRTLEAKLAALTSDPPLSPGDRRP